MSSITLHPILRMLDSIPGRKLLTFFINGNPYITDHPAYNQSEIPELLRLAESADCASLLIRQFIPATSCSITNSDGSLFDVPMKAVFGFYFCHGTWNPLSADAMEEATSYDIHGNRVFPEGDVIYRDAHEFISQH